MEITEVRIFPFQGNGTLKAYASLTIEDQVVVRGIRVIEGRNGLFASMPSRKWKDEYYDIFFPITAEMREVIQEKVIEAYQSQKQKAV